jgi:hypothetical protein
MFHWEETPELDDFLRCVHCNAPVRYTRSGLLLENHSRKLHRCAEATSPVRSGWFDGDGRAMALTPSTETR